MKKASALAFTVGCLFLGSALAEPHVGKHTGIHYSDNGVSPKAVIKFKRLAFGKPSTEYRCRSLKRTGENQWTVVDDWNGWERLSKNFVPTSDVEYWEVEFRTTDGTPPPLPQLVDLTPKPFNQVGKRIEATVAIDYGPPESRKGSPAKPRKKP